MTPEVRKDRASLVTRQTAEDMRIIKIVTVVTHTVGGRECFKPKNQLRTGRHGCLSFPWTFHGAAKKKPWDLPTNTSGRN